MVPIMTKITDEEYAKMLPKTGRTAVLFFNSEGDLLIVKPDYKDGWLVPGGNRTKMSPSPLCGSRNERRDRTGNS